ncbi:MAG: energy-coupled thiamine transporter ThiT [Oscillospiraceae bacterium]|nr:energy-coupled thiamine transporter ThiT [Oscillospiraceae bacterium]
MEKTKTKLLTEAGILIAVSLLLDYIIGHIQPKLWAQGGSINIAFLPIVLYSVRNFAKPNGATFSILVGVLSRGMAMLWATPYHPLSAIFDYILVGALFGAVGIITKIKLGDYAELSIVVFGLLALCSHIVSGVLVFAAYMPDVYFGMEMANMWVYSTIYNATHMIPNTILTVFLFSLIPKQLKTAAVPAIAN